MATTTGYQKPRTVEVLLLHRPMGWLARHGITLNGKAELAVRGRRSGEWRTVPVNPLPLGGERFLVAPRGTTQWVRNLRAAGGEGELRTGGRPQPFTAAEVADAGKPEVLRAYLRRWGREAGAFFGGLNAGSTDAEFLAAAGRHPVFRLVTPDGRPRSGPRRG